MHVEIRTLPELRVAAVRHLGPYDRISEAFARLGGIALDAGLFGPQGAMLAIYHDDPRVTSPALLRSDAALVVERDRALPPEVCEAWIPAGRYACTKHVGPYEDLGATWVRFLTSWLEPSGYRRAPGPAYEHYCNTPAEVSEEELLTELYVPLEA